MRSSAWCAPAPPRPVSWRTGRRTSPPPAALRSSTRSRGSSRTLPHSGGGPGPRPAEPTPDLRLRSVRAPGLHLVDEITGYLPQFAVGDLGLRGQHVEGGVGADPVPPHEDALRL